MGEKRKSDAMDLSLTSLDGFKLERVLGRSALYKSVAVVGTFEGREGRAVLSMQRRPFDEGALPEMLSAGASLSRDFQNAEYGIYSMLPPEKHNALKCDITYPATEKHMAKFVDPRFLLLQETPEMYKTITWPYVQREELGDRIGWVHNILDKKKETERIIFEDPDPQTGFVLLPDMKWDQANADDLYCLAIVHRRDLPSLRALGAEHLPLLKNLFEKGCGAILEKYGVPRSQLRVYLHYQPTFYHLHVHFTAVNSSDGGCSIGKAHNLLDVMENIRLLPSYYQDVNLQCILRDSLGLTKEFEKAGVDTAPAPLP
ncbi:HIT-like domain-containing protein [Baffinella frigidus]|nr:HIT-like domain-containing protein [Cryptophyta sp. CCMP2293]